MMIEKTAIGVQVLQHERREAELRVSDGKVEITRCEIRKGNVSFQTTRTNDTENDFPVMIASMPGIDTFHRCYEFPWVEDGQLEKVILNRLEADLPVPTDQLTWGYRKSKSRETGEEKWVVCVQAARSEQVNRQIASLRSSGSMNAVLTTEAEGIIALYRYGIQHLEGVGTDVVILADKEQWLVAEVSDGLVKQLRKIKRNGNNGRLMLRECVHVIEANVSERVRQLLWAADADENITMKDVQNALQPDVVPMNLSETMTMSPSISPDVVARYGVAIGLALAGVHGQDEIVCLAGKTIAMETSRYPRLKKWLSHPVRWSVTAMLMVLLSSSIHLWALEWENRQMRLLLDEFDPNNSTIVNLEQKVEHYIRLKDYRIDVKGVLVDICRAMPDPIVISSIRLSREKKLVIRGSAKDPKAVFSFADTLRKSNRLAAVQPEHTEPGRGGGFTVSAELIGVKSLNTFNGRGEQWR